MSAKYTDFNDAYRNEAKANATNLWNLAHNYKGDYDIKHIPVGTVNPFNVTLNTSNPEHVKLASSYSTTLKVSQSQFESVGSENINYTDPTAMHFKISNLNLNNKTELESQLASQQQAFQTSFHNHILNSRSTPLQDSSSAPSLFLTVIPTSKGPNIIKGVGNNCSWSKGFRRGWYNNVYFRVVDEKGTVVGGTQESPDLYNTANLDMGVPGTRMIATTMGSEPLFCRGLTPSNSSSFPDMACVKFDAHGKVLDPLYMRGKVGSWKDYGVLYKVLSDAGRFDTKLDPPNEETVKRDTPPDFLPFGNDFKADTKDDKKLCSLDYQR
jgi:hypothetical protein